MNKSLLQNAKSYVFELLEYNGRRPLSVLCKDSCSEVSRLLAVWLRKELPSAKIYIAKGKIRNLFHDLLIVKVNDKVYVVDPTVWQFFENKKSILIDKASDAGEALKVITKIYTGKWKVSEQITNYSKKEIQELKDTVAKQIK
jgi:hypothetical protein